MELILCITISVIIFIYLSHGLINKYLDLKTDTSKDMEVLADKILSATLNVVDKLVKEPTDVNKNVLMNLAELTLSVKKIAIRIESLTKMENDIKDLQGIASTMQVGKAFMPRRRD